MYYDKIDYLVDLYARKLAENLNQANAIDARVPSILISGGSNFPVRKKEKQNAARDKNMGEFMYIQGLLNKIRSTGMGGISADDRQAVEKLEAKLDGLKAEQEHMKIVNAYYRKHKTLEGCPGLTPEGVLELQASMSRDWRKKPVPYGVGGKGAHEHPGLLHELETERGRTTLMRALGHFVPKLTGRAAFAVRPVSVWRGGKAHGHDISKAPPHQQRQDDPGIHAGSF